MDERRALEDRRAHVVGHAQERPNHMAPAWTVVAPLGPRRDLGFLMRQDPRHGLYSEFYS